jgi:glycosyltransferase involved in cell wall biosynthesis
MKGSLVLLAAIPTVLRHRRDVAFVFAGNWSHALHREIAEWYIAQHRLTSYVTFTGEVTGLEKHILLRSADVFVFPGLQQEGQPLVVLEAMAAGLPIIFTNQGCLRETVVNGECGIETYTEDPYDLAQRLCCLLDHPEDQRRFGRNARRRCQLLYNKDKYIDRMIQVFHDVMASPSRSHWSSPLGASQTH